MRKAFPSVFQSAFQPISNIDTGIDGINAVFENTTSAGFLLVAAGEFEVDWGDGTVESISRSTAQSVVYTTAANYTHTYAESGTYTVKITGAATEFATASTNVNSICFYSYASYLTELYANLDQVFPDTDSRTFVSMCRDCSVLENINLIVSGEAHNAIFFATFQGCSSLQTVPALFKKMTGTPSGAMYAYTFFNCTSLISVPKGLFGSLSGVPASSIFAYTFSGCTGLIDISGGFENWEFEIDTASNSMIRTYNGCSAATSASPADKNGVKFYDWDNTATDLNTFLGATLLSDYSTIPVNRK